MQLLCLSSLQREDATLSLPIETSSQCPTACPAGPGNLDPGLCPGLIPISVPWRSPSAQRLFWSSPSAGSPILSMSWTSYSSHSLPGTFRRIPEGPCHSLQPPGLHQTRLGAPFSPRRFSPIPLSTDHQGRTHPSIQGATDTGRVTRDC